MSRKNTQIMSRSSEALVDDDISREEVTRRRMTHFVEINRSVAPRAASPKDISGDEGVRDRVFAVSENLIAFVSKGPLLPGHSLICPRVPTRCLGEILSDIAIRDELFAFFSDVAKLLTKVFGGELLHFEHGGASGLRPIGSSVTHAHLHVLPGVPAVAFNRLIDDQDALVQNPSFKWEMVKGIQSTIYPAAEWQEYLFLGCDRSAWLARVPENQVVPSQFLRQAVGAAVGNPKWNWREWPNEDIVAGSLKRISEELTSRKSSLLGHLPQVFASPFTRVERY